MLQLFQQAGIVAWPLGLCSVLALGVILERFYTLSKLRQQEALAFTTLQKALRDGDDAAVSRAEIAAAPLTHMTQALLPLRGASEETILQAAEVALGMQRMRLRRYLGTLATIGSTAPFVGLFGTVLGVMVAFHGMSQQGLSGEVMAAGISEALSATALGLAVAIPAVISYNYFVGRVSAFLLEVNGHMIRLAPLLHAASAEKTSAPRVREGQPV